MKHRLFIMLAILSFLPIPILAGIWISSYPWQTHLWSNYEIEAVGSAPVPRRQGYSSLTCFHGTLCYRRHVGPVKVGENLRLRQNDWRWGFGRIVSVSTQDPSHVMTDIWIPCWAVLPLAAIPAAWGTTVIYGQWLLRYRRRKGLCSRCGYDLRASPERCPECGTALPADAERKPIQ